jgi:DNA modification methylase
MTVRILKGDCREALRAIPDESVHCVVTSPPYYGLRDYGVAGQIGLESSPEAFVQELVGVFRDVRRVMRRDGTLWLNLGDSYAANRGSGDRVSADSKQATNVGSLMGELRVPLGLKAKDLIGIPWRVAFALQADGWYLRQDIIWSKPNPMPESVTDRCTKAHEYIFLLSKSGRYYFDQAAILEPIAAGSIARFAQDIEAQAGSDRVPGKTNGRMKSVRRQAPGAAPDRNDTSAEHSGTKTCGFSMDGRNKRSVWEVTTQPFSEAHFATFPPALIEPCILAGCPEGGTVLDPFGGAGTTGMVADRLKRNAILIELNPEYAAMAERRIKDDAGMFASVAAE